jgi:hypothetical protein
LIPSERIFLTNGTELVLTGCLIYGIGGAHYTAIFRCRESWYFYNDMGVGNSKDTFIEHIADSWDEMIQWNNGIVCTNGSHYFYAQEQSI